MGKASDEALVFTRLAASLAIMNHKDIEAGLLAQAQTQGLDVPHYVEHLVRVQALSRTHTVAASRPAYELPPQEWIRAFRAWTHSHDHDDLPILSDEATSRETIYEDRGL